MFDKFYLCCVFRSIHKRIQRWVPNVLKGTFVHRYRFLYDTNHDSFNHICGNIIADKGIENEMREKMIIREIR